MAKPSAPPTLDEWLKSAQHLATLVERALAQHGSVPRGQLEKAVKRFRRADFRAM